MKNAQKGMKDKQLSITFIAKLVRRRKLRRYQL